MRPRLVLIAAVVAGSMSVGTSALARGGGHGPSQPPAGEHEKHRAERPHQRGVFSFGLSGAQVPDGGDPAGRANATLRLDPAREVVCLRTDWRDLAGEVTAIHLHRAPAGQNGPHHIEILNDESLTGEWNRVEFCVKVTGGHHAQAEGHGDGGEPADRIQAVVDDPGQFYLNVHTTAFPEGAIRGQLEG